MALIFENVIFEGCKTAIDAPQTAKIKLFDSAFKDCEIAVKRRQNDIDILEENLVADIPSDVLSELLEKIKKSIENENTDKEKNDIVSQSNITKYLKNGANIAKISTAISNIASQLFDT